MHTEGKKDLVGISSYAGARRDYVQGGGGNTSMELVVRSWRSRRAGTRWRGSRRKQDM